MDTIACDIPQVICYIADILVTSKNIDKHFQHLEKDSNVSNKMEFKSIKQSVNFKKKSIKYYDQKISDQGILPISSKVNTVFKAPKATNKTELSLF